MLANSITAKPIPNSFSKGKNPKYVKKKCNLKKTVSGSFTNKSCGMLTSSLVFRHDNMHLHIAAHTRALLENFKWELFKMHKCNKG
jgi:hypothetical protein